MIAQLTRDFLEILLPSEFVGVSMVILTVFALINGIMFAVLLLTYAERRIIGRMQNRIGPNRVGPMGLLQGVADLVKLVIKEDIVPSGADRWMFNAAPIVAFIPAILMYAVIPFHKGWVLADLDAGIVYLVAVTSVGTLAVFMAGWASSNKYSLFGAIRAVAQIVSYEVPMVLSVVSVVILAGSLNLQRIVEAQGIPFILVQPLAFLIFLLAIVAELSRTPFDLVEAESEIVAGFHTEYSGMKFGLFLAAEYAAMLGWAAVVTTVFLGGWKPDTGGPLWWLLKTLAVVFIFFWFRGTWPRVRIDQILGLAWKVLFPLATLNILVTAGEVLAVQEIYDLTPGDALPIEALVPMAAVNIGLTILTLLALSKLLRPHIQPNLPTMKATPETPYLVPSGGH